MLRIYLAGAAVAVLLIAGWWLHHAGFKAGAESVRAELREQADLAAADARLLSRERVATAQRIDADVLTKKRAAEALAAAGRADGDRLRGALAHRGQPGAGADAGQCDAERAYSQRLARLLDESSRLVEEGAGIVDDAVIRIEGLQQRAGQR